MKITFLLFVGISPLLNAQSDYKIKLNSKIAELEKLSFYSRDVTTYSENECVLSGFERWSAEKEYIKTDRVCFEGKDCEALVDSRGKIPTASPDEWFVFNNYHPYRFLRDTAQTEDLVELTKSKNPIVMTYAFSALSHRNYSDLFETILNHLSDKNEISVHNEDVKMPAYPGDVMLWDSLDKFNPQQRRRLKLLVKKRYKHLNEYNSLKF